jgi:hypothetical protein
MMDWSDFVLGMFCGWSFNMLVVIPLILAMTKRIVD